jgi:hypothetical protein
MEVVLVTTVTNGTVISMVNPQQLMDQMQEQQFQLHAHVNLLTVDLALQPTNVLAIMYAYHPPMILQPCVFVLPINLVDLNATSHVAHLILTVKAKPPLHIALTTQITQFLHTAHVHQIQLELHVNKPQHVPLPHVE